MKLSLKKFAVIYILTSLLVACGGGDEDEAKTPKVNPPTVDLPKIDPGKPIVLTSDYAIDDNLDLILYNGKEFKLRSALLIASRTFTVNTQDQEKALIKGKAFLVKEGTETYSLYRTELPIMTISTDGGQTIIGDEESKQLTNEPKEQGDTKTPGLFSILAGDDSVINKEMGIKVRGGTSRSYEKKSYSLELQNSDKESYKESLLQLRTDDDWILDGMWNEPLRLRDFVSHALWLKMGRYPYSDKKPDITLGINKKFVELFRNGEYRGVYYLGEKVDRKQLGLKKYKDEIKGELYKGSQNSPSVFFQHQRKNESISDEPVSWEGYEAKYPKDRDEIDMVGLKSLITFVMDTGTDSNGSKEKDVKFNSGIENNVDIKNMADYYIFINLIYAKDNLGKNIYTARYTKSSPYFYVPWDMDGSFGIKYNGEHSKDWDIGKPVNIHWQSILHNGLFERLKYNPAFSKEVEERWKDLRKDVLTAKVIQAMFDEQYHYLKDNGVYKREALNSALPFHNKIGESVASLNPDDESVYTKQWIVKRLEMLDYYFKDFEAKYSGKQYKPGKNIKK